MRGKYMLGIGYDKKHKMFNIYDMEVCQCGSRHVCMNIIRADSDVDRILKELKTAMEKVKVKK